MCTEKKCCVAETDACYQRNGRAFMLCRPVRPDGSCVDQPDWLCPGSALSAAIRASDAAAQAQLSAPAQAVAPATTSSDASSFGGTKTSPIVMGLVATACATVLLVGLFWVIRAAAQRHQRAKRAGGGSARRRAKHTKLDGEAEDDDDEEEEEGEDDIIGDEDEIKT